MLSKSEHMQPAQGHQNTQDPLLQADQQAPQNYSTVQQSYQQASMQMPGADQESDQQASMQAPRTDQQGDPQASMQTPQTDQQGYPQDVPTQPLQERDAPDYSYSPGPKRGGMVRKSRIPLLVALVVILGVASYVIAGLLGVHLPGFRGTQPPVTTMIINSSVPYAGVDITILNVQQSQSFFDDPNSGSNGMVRLNLREQNNTAIKVSWSYNNIARLILPDKSMVSPAYVKARVGIAPGVSQTSVVDFAVPVSDKIGQLALRLGAANEAQMLIPLAGKADLSKYQPKSINLNGQMLYFGLNWTLTSATSSLNIDGQQAARGMRYIIVTLKVDNTLSQVAITGSPYGYIRLKFGNTTASPKNTTLPVSFDQGASGITGTVSFLAPQGSQSFTLLLLPQGHDSGDQASVDFQLA